MAKGKYEEILINRIAGSGLITVKMEKFLPEPAFEAFDIQPYLFKGLILKEKDFRESLKNVNWSEFSGKNITVHCSVDTIIPKWAYMLVASYLSPIAADLQYGTIEEAAENHVAQKIQELDVSDYRDQRIILKGCSDGRDIPASAYLQMTKKCLPFVKSLMYGEPCSTVPIYKAAPIKS